MGEAEERIETAFLTEKNGFSITSAKDRDFEWRRLFDFLCRHENTKSAIKVECKFKMNPVQRNGKGDFPRCELTSPTRSLLIELLLEVGRASLEIQNQNSTPTKKPSSTQSGAL